MIYLAGSCTACPAYQADVDGVCGCMAARGDSRSVSADAAAAGRPEWCPLEISPVKLYEANDATQASCADCSAWLVHACTACPFYYETNKRRCNVGNPKGRPIHTDDPRPTWCLLCKESVIIRKKTK